jgi:hypothetical protein
MQEVWKYCPAAACKKTFRKMKEMNATGGSRVKVLRARRKSENARVSAERCIRRAGFA